MNDLPGKLREAFKRKRYGAGEYDPDFDLFDAAADEIERLRNALDRADEALNQMLIWMPSGFAPVSQANALRLTHESRQEIAGLHGSGQG